MCWLESCWCYVAGLAVGDVVSECRLNHREQSGSAYTRIPHHQQTIPLHNTNTPQVSLHNNAPSSRKLLKMDILTSETCWAVNWHNKASVLKLVYLYSNIKMMHGPIRIRTLFCLYRNENKCVFSLVSGVQKESQGPCASVIWGPIKSFVNLLPDRITLIQNTPFGLKNRVTSKRHHNKF